MEGSVVGEMVGGGLVEDTVLRLVRTTITQRRRANELNGTRMAQIAD